MGAEAGTPRASQGNVGQLQLFAEGQQVRAVVVPAKTRPRARAEARRHGKARADFDHVTDNALPRVSGRDASS